MGDFEIFTQKISATPRGREGPLRCKGLPRRRQLRLSEPEDNGGLSGLPRGGVARLGETTPPRQRQATPRCTCDGPGPVFVACFGLVSWPGL